MSMSEESNQLAAVVEAALRKSPFTVENTATQTLLPLRKTGLLDERIT